MSDLISRQALCEYALNQKDKSVTPNDIMRFPSAQPERLTDDDFETIRIHLNAQKEKLCNQHRWKEAEEYQRIIDRFMAFASAQPETKQGEWIPHSEKYTFPGTEETSSGGVMCSSCGFRTHNRMHKLIGCPYNYCPMCGTSMRKENRDGQYNAGTFTLLVDENGKPLVWDGKNER